MNSCHVASKSCKTDMTVNDYRVSPSKIIKQMQNVLISNKENKTAFNPDMMPNPIPSTVTLYSTTYPAIRW